MSNTISNIVSNSPSNNAYNKVPLLTLSPLIELLLNLKSLIISMVYKLLCVTLYVTMVLLYCYFVVTKKLKSVTYFLSNTISNRLVTKNNTVSNTPSNTSSNTYQKTKILILTPLIMVLLKNKSLNKSISYKFHLLLKVLLWCYYCVTGMLLSVTQIILAPFLLYIKNINKNKKINKKNKILFIFNKSFLYKNKTKTYRKRLRLKDFSFSFFLGCRISFFLFLLKVELMCINGTLKNLIVMEV